MNVLPTGTAMATCLGSGHSKLRRFPHRKDRRCLRETASEHGVRHFDVVYMYGLGAAKRTMLVNLGHGFVRASVDCFHAGVVK